MYRNEILDREYINSTKGLLVAEMNLMDVGYSLQDIANIDENNIFKARNDMEKKYCQAHAKDEEAIIKLTEAGYKVADFNELYIIAEQEIKLEEELI